jgi:hypothetical protein
MEYRLVGLPDSPLRRIILWIFSAEKGDALTILIEKFQ